MMSSTVRCRTRPRAPAPAEQPELAPELLGLTVVYRGLTVLSPAPRSLRRHSRRQLRKIAESIRNFGFLDPILVDAEYRIIAGHGRYEAAKMLGLKMVPTICVSHLTPEQVRVLRITHNRLAELAEWDEALLAIEWQELEALDLSIPLEVTGFETVDIDRIIAAVSAGSAEQVEDPVPEPEIRAVSRLGDRWLLGSHRLNCADALQASSYRDLLGGERAQMVFTDPPYNVPIQGHVSGLGRTQHREFAMASGEMSEAQFTEFLTTMCRQLVTFASDGAIHYLCMDWRHMRELLAAGATA
ncbi:MAG TPA: ParB/Srx family N-terminal domain-containing protein, partial [Acetobacteraceae bacterium]|nr:ParB/Srx family N-terminal domain-containing protein [Acetobacteraceae bacterium]